MWTRVVSKFGDLLLEPLEADVPTTPGSRFAFGSAVYEVTDPPASVQKQHIDDGTGEEMAADVATVTARLLPPEPKIGPPLPAVPLKQPRGLNGPAQPYRVR